MASNSTTRIHGDFPRTRDLFRRPAGLADGLALKEPAPPTAFTVRLAPTSGSPAPGLHTRDSALMRGNLPHAQESMQSLPPARVARGDPRSRRAPLVPLGA